MAGPSILIVDDDPAVRGLLRVIAERLGIAVDVAADGIQCLELLDRNVYDVILLDLSMPVMNGYDVIECLRRKPRCPAVIVLTALTRWSFNAIDPAVVHCVLRKPFDLDFLSALLSSTASAMYERRAGNSARLHAEPLAPPLHNEPIQ